MLKVRSVRKILLQHTKKGYVTGQEGVGRRDRRLVKWIWCCCPEQVTQMSDSWWWKLVIVLVKPGQWPTASVSTNQNSAQDQLSNHSQAILTTRASFVSRVWAFQMFTRQNHVGLVMSFCDYSFWWLDWKWWWWYCTTAQLMLYISIPSPSSPTLQHSKVCHVMLVGWMPKNRLKYFLAFVWIFWGLKAIKQQWGKYLFFH